MNATASPAVPVAVTMPTCTGSGKADIFDTVANAWACNTITGGGGSFPSGTGIAVVTSGTSWGTTLTTTGSGTVVALASDSTFTTGATFSSAPITIGGNISSPAWLGTGIRIKESPVTLTDTSSSGPVAAAFTDVFGGDTISASSPTTYT